MQLLTRKTLRDLRRSLAQTAALVGVLALAVSSFVAAVGAYLDLDASESRTFERLRFADAWFELEPSDSGLVDEVAATPGVAAATGRLVIDTGLPVGDEDDRVRARLIGTPPDAGTNRVEAITGSSRLAAGEVLVERHFAEARGIAVGDTITPMLDGERRSLRVAGTVASPEYLQVTPDRFELLPSPSSFAVLFVPLADLQAFSQQPGVINDLSIRLDPGSDEAVDAVEARLRDDGLLRQTTRRRDQATYAALEQDLQAFRSIAFAMPTLILVAGVVSVAVLLGRIIRTQRPIIGVIKAVGYSDGAVLRHYLTYALVLGAVGSVVGAVAGTALGSVITRGYAAELGIPSTVTSVHPWVALTAVVFILVAVTVAAAHPAWRSARLAPAAAVRLDVAATGPGRRGRLERVVPLPLAVRLPLRTMRRARGRTLATIAGITTAFVLVLMVLGLRDGIDLFLKRTFDDLERWDVSATFDTPQSPAVVDRARRIPGVEAVSPFLQLPGTVATTEGREEVLVTAFDPDQDLRALRTGSTSATEALRPGAIVLTDGLAADLGLEPGDSVDLTSPAGTHELVLGGTSDEPIPARAYVSLATAADLAGSDEPPLNGLYIRAEDDAAPDIRRQLFDLPGAESVELRDEQRDDLRSLLAIFNAIIAVMLSFAVAMAFALVFNTMTINVLEREREYATMRSLGTRPSAIAGLLATEGVLLWLLASVPGCLAGTWVARRLGDAVAAGLFDLPIQISSASYATTILGILAVVLAALLLPLRRVSRLDLASATKTLT